MSRTISVVMIHLREATWEAVGRAGTRDQFVVGRRVLRPRVMTAVLEEGRF
jgi:hypothetical protein